MNPATHEVSRAGKEIALTLIQFRILESLLSRSGRVVTKKELGHSVWDFNGDVDDNLIHVFIHQLRKKVDRNHKVKVIKTVRKVGYAIGDPGTAE